MAETSKYKFYLPQGNEQFDITHTNDNFMKTDKIIYNNRDKYVVCSTNVGQNVKQITIPDFEIINDFDTVNILFSQGVVLSGQYISIKETTTNEIWDLLLENKKGGQMLLPNTYYTFQLDNTNKACRVLGMVSGLRLDKNAQVSDFISTHDIIEQSWTPEIPLKATGATYLTRWGKYRRNGNLVIGNFLLEFNYSGFFASAESIVQIGGFPYEFGGYSVETIFYGDAMRGRAKLLNFLTPDTTAESKAVLKVFDEAGGLRTAKASDLENNFSLVAGKVELKGNFIYSINV